MIVQQIAEKTGLHIEPVRENPEKDGNGKRKRIMLFEVIDKENDEILVTFVFPRAWLYKVFGPATAAILAVIYALLEVL